MPETELFALLDSTAAAAYTITEGGEICSWNAAAERRFGYSASDVPARNIVELFDTRDALGTDALAGGLDAAARRWNGSRAESRISTWKCARGREPGSRSRSVASSSCSEATRRPSPHATHFRPSRRARRTPWSYRVTVGTSPFHWFRSCVHSPNWRLWSAKRTGRDSVERHEWRPAIELGYPRSRIDGGTRNAADTCSCSTRRTGRRAVLRPLVARYRREAP